MLWLLILAGSTSTSMVFVRLIKPTYYVSKSFVAKYLVPILITFLFNNRLKRLFVIPSKAIYLLPPRSIEISNCPGFSINILGFTDTIGNFHVPNLEASVLAIFLELCLINE